MKAFICAIALALMPVVGNAADMHGFDYTGTGNPVALAAPSETRVGQALAVAKPVPSPMFLTRDSDYSKFLGADVPLETHRQAMRLLWQTNPQLGLPTKEDTLAIGYVTIEAPQTASLGAARVAALTD